MELVIVTTVTALAAAGLLLPELAQTVGLRAATGHESLIGAQGEVLEAVAESGRVKVRGEAWLARSFGKAAISSGAKIEVRAIDGLTLLVEEATGPPLEEPPRTWSARHPVRAGLLATVACAGAATLLLLTHTVGGIGTVPDRWTDKAGLVRQRMRTSCRVAIVIAALCLPATASAQAAEAKRALIRACLSDEVTSEAHKRWCAERRTRRNRAETGALEPFRPRQPAPRVTPAAWSFSA